MEITSILSLLKGMPESFTLILVCLVLFFSLFLKKKDVDLTQVTSISKLQTDQLTQLIQQNTALAEELKEVRKELSETYRMINDMRDRISELEEMLRHREEVLNRNDVT